jgi:hypothetical protein
MAGPSGHRRAGTSLRITPGARPSCPCSPWPASWPAGRRYPSDSSALWVPVGPNGAGQARAGTGAVGSRDGLDAPGDKSPGRAPEPATGFRRGQRQRGAVIMSAGRAGPAPRRTVASPAGSAGVILRGWKPITRPGRHRRPGSASTAGRAHAHGQGPRAEARYGPRQPPGLTGSPGIVQASEVPGDG